MGRRTARHARGWSVARRQGGRRRAGVERPVVARAKVQDVVGRRYAHEPQHLGPPVQAAPEASHQGSRLGQQAVPHPL